MSSVTNGEFHYPPAPEAVREQTRKLLDSAVFASSPSLSRFLAYVVDETLDGRSAQVKEYVIGVSVLGRPDDYDPRLDPIVRVQARNLRNRLKIYYEGVGATDSVLIELPKGSYVPVFRWALPQAESPVPLPVAHTPDPEPKVSVADEATRRTSRARWAGAAAMLALAGWTGLQLMSKAEFAPGADRMAVRSYSPVAEQLYARGRYFYAKHSDEALRRSVGYFERSVTADPEFAPGYAGLAEAVNVLVQYGQIPPREGMPRAKEAALRAIELDPNLPDAHVALGAVLEAYDWDFDAARREFRRAVELDPRHARARLWYGLFLWDQGDFDAAFPELERAHQLDPVSVFTTAGMASVEMRRGHFDRALALFNDVLELEPMSASAHLKLAMLYHKASRVPESIQAMERARQIGAENPMMLAWAAASYQRWGMKEQARRVVADLENLALRKYVSPFDLAMAYDATGDAERAISYLERAYEERSSGFAYFSKRKFHTVQSHPRFAALLSKASQSG
jgi:tetratricopeptide (TPR) repeat protein